MQKDIVGVVVGGLVLFALVAVCRPASKPMPTQPFPKDAPPVSAPKRRAGRQKQRSRTRLPTPVA